MEKQVPKTKVPKSLKPGLYQHYKGPMYLVIGFARNANKEDELSIIYHSVEPHGNQVPMLTYRKVDGEDGFFTPVQIDGEWRERFTYLYPLNTTEAKRPTVKK